MKVKASNFFLLFQNKLIMVNTDSLARSSGKNRWSSCRKSTFTDFLVLKINEIREEFVWTKPDYLAEL